MQRSELFVYKARKVADIVSLIAINLQILFFFVSFENQNLQVMKDYKVDKARFSATFCEEVYQVVREIPAGKVSTYGEIAALLGMPQCSRMVGRALKQVPEEMAVPCHRVVNATGRIVPGWEEQRSLLQEEGVAFKQNGCVDLKKHLFGCSSEE